LAARHIALNQKTKSAKDLLATNQVVFEALHGVALKGF
jgi:hypothetical protein